MLPTRKKTRLEQLNYEAGVFFITFCTQDKRCLLSDLIVGEGLAPPEIRLTAVGKIVDEQIRAIPGRYPAMTVDKYVIMPNHVHLLLSIDAGAGGTSPSPTAADGGCPQGSAPTVMDAVRVIKSVSTRLSGRGKLWQRSFHDHIVRGEQDYREIWLYIDENPQKWKRDELYEK